MIGIGVAVFEVQYSVLDLTIYNLFTTISG
jgi:hypothetical protein